MEIKSFINPSFITAFYEAVGKFSSYGAMLGIKEPERQLFLAVPMITYNKEFDEIVVAAVVKQLNIKIMVYNPITKSVEQWIN